MSSKHEFAHLHLHGEHSLTDGLGKIERTVEAASKLGFDKLGLTDHGNLSGAISFSQACKSRGIKPIIGIEAYVARDGKRFHLTLLADGNLGFNTLVELNNAGQTGEDPTRPTFDISLLHRHNQGVVLLTGCAASPFQDSEWSDAVALVHELKPHFDGRFFAETMFISAGGNSPWERSAKLAKDLNLPVVVTNDVHFPYAHDATAHHMLTQMKAAFSYESRFLYLATPGQLLSRVRDLTPSNEKLLMVGMRNANRLAKKMGVVNFDASPQLPYIENADAVLGEQVINALSARFGGDTVSPAYQEYHHRATDELGVIRDIGVAGYFLILADIINWSRGQGIRVGPGRGSGAGSLVVYLLGMTEIDPIEFGLSFDRFLNRKRAELPDIDTDFESERRAEVIEYAKRRWSALPIATFTRYMHKLLVHDLSRLYRVDRALDEAAADGGPESEEFVKLSTMYPDFAKSYEAISGQIRNVGQHAGGVCISKSASNIPLERTAAGDPVVGWTEGEYRELTIAGIVKFDLLGLSALSILRRMEEAVGQRAPTPEDDSPVFSLFQKGDLTGIFQFAGSEGIARFTKEVKPRTFEDLVAINAIYRPGALDAGAAEKFPEWRRTGARLLDPLIDDIIRPTYGVIAYQEQMMAIYRTVTDGDEADADLARKVLAKARPGQPDWEVKYSKLKVAFHEGARRHGWSEAKADLVLGELLTYTRYGFNRSHAVAYSRLAWDLAWFKYYHPIHFYAAQLNVDVANWQKLLFEAISKGVSVKAPHLNTSTREFEVKGDIIYLPLNIIKYLGDSGVHAILTAKPFATVSEFMAKVPAKAVNARARRGLYAMGAFDGIEGATEETLKIKPIDSVDDVMTEFLGFPLPTPEQLRRVSVATRNGFTAGIVSKVEIRTSKYGAYRVYQLLPSGAVWERSGPELKVGQWVKLRTDPKNGRIKHSESL